MIIETRHAQSLAALTLLACGATAQAADAAKPGACPASGARVWLQATGEVLLNGRPLAAPRLQDALSALQPRPTVICYARENAEDEPPPTMETVLEALMAQRLPIGLYTDDTFATPAVD